MIRVTKSVITGNQEDGSVIRNLYGYCNEEDITENKMPKENVGNGSVFVETDNWKGYGFNESTQEWGLTPIQIVINPASGVEF